jgi:hypothetical protein
MDGEADVGLQAHDWHPRLLEVGRRFVVTHAMDIVAYV